MQQHELIQTEHDMSSRFNENKDQSIENLLNNQTGGIEDAKVTRVYFQRFVQFEMCCAYMNIIVASYSVVVHDLIFDDSFNDIQDVILWTLVIFSGLLGFITLLRYKSLLDWHRVRGIMSKHENLYSSGLIYYYLGELTIIIAIPNPWFNDIQLHFYNEVQMMDAYYNLNDLMCMVSIFRLIFVARYILVQTKWFCNRAQRICNIYAIEANYLFVIKSIMRTRPYEAIFITMGSLVFIFGYAIRIAESSLNRNDISFNYFRSYPNSFWNIIVTMTTLGYGDLYARTTLGRLLIVFICIFGIFIVSMMVVTLTNSLQTSHLESKAVTVLQRVVLRRKMVEEAATVLTIMAKIQIRQRNGTLRLQEYNHLINKMNDFKKRFKLTHRKYRSLRDGGSLRDEMHSQFSNLKEDFKEINKKQESLYRGTQEIMELIALEKQTLINNYEHLDQHELIQSGEQYTIVK